MMLKLSLRGLWAHKQRLVGTFAAVFLGVAFLTGTLIVSDTLSSSIDRFFQQAYGGTDVVVRSASQVANGTTAPRDNIPASIVETVKSVPGVAVADPVIEGSGQLLDQSGIVVQTRGPRRATNWIQDPTLNPYHVVDGRAPQAAGEVVIDRQSALNNHLSVGDTVALITPQRVTMKIVGIVMFGSANSDGGGSYVGMTMADAQRYLVSSPNQISSISVEADPGVSSDGLSQRIQAVLPAHIEAVTGQTLTQESFDSVNQGFLTLFRTFLVAFAVVALVVALFSIYNTFSIITAQRNRESAMLRAIGASRRQILATVLVESLAVGVIASAGGFVGGIGVAALLGRAFKSGLGIPITGVSVTVASAVIGIGVGVLVSLIASLLPALHASRIPPIAALREASLESTELSHGIVVAGTICLLAGILTTAGAATLLLSRDALLLAGLGAVLIVIACILLSPVVASPLSAILGMPAARMRGIPGRLARRNAMSSPQRTARATTALFLGIGVVTVFSILVASLSAGLNDNLDHALKADLVISTGNQPADGFSTQLAQTISLLPQVKQTTSVMSGSVLIDGQSSNISAVDPASLGNLLQVTMTSGSLANLGPGRIAVSSSAAKANGWSTGQRVTLVFPDGSSSNFTVAAEYSSTSILNDELIPASVWTAHAVQPTVDLLLVGLRPGVSLADGMAAVLHAARTTGSPPVQTRAEFITAQRATYGTILDVAYGLLAFAVLIALMSIGNTLSLSVYERTREFGLLRAVGATPQQLRSMVRWESVIVALFGTLVGVAIGLLVGWGLASAIGRTETSVISFPTLQIVAILIVGILAGVLAAIRPAGRAAKLDVLVAISSE